MRARPQLGFGGSAPDLLPDHNRPDPDALIAAAAAAERGRLKIFLGAAPGVGKTWEMLSQARRRRDDGLDVLGGIIETHGRAQTIAQMDGLALLPQREIAYRGQTLHEFDLDAALARRPGLLLVDELAHTNVPGSRHAKRWEDVAELLAAGIDVWATLNVQHLESLNDDIARITGVRVSETLPDRVLQLADQIELIDATPQELRDRLREGHIYGPETARRALDGFFKEGNLTSLREIALRRAAAHVDGAVRDWLRRSGVSGPWPSAERVLALIGPDAASGAVVRQAKRLADALAAPWTALHVERATSLAATGPMLALATQLGAEVETRVGTDLVATTLDAAQRCHATHLVLGRAQTRGWRRLLGRTLAAELLRRAPHYAVHVIPLPDTEVRRWRRARLQTPWRDWLIAGGLLAAVTLGGRSLHAYLPESAVGMLYLAATVVTSVRSGRRVALAMAAAGFLAWDFFFIPPLYRITIRDPSDLVALVVFALVAVLCGGLAARLRDEAQAAETRIEGLRRIGAFSRRLGAAATEPALLAEIAGQAAAIGGEAVVLAGDGEALDQRAAAPADPAPPLDEGALAAARWASVHAEPAGQGTSTLPGASWRFLPLRTPRARLGVLGVRGARLDPSQSQTLETLVDQAAVAWDRMLLAHDSARATALEETQRLRTALLASLGHDLRTPLTGIRGAAGTLRGAWDKLDPATRADLLDSIEQDVGRMARFLGNITDLTRLESGQISPRLADLSLADVVSAAIAQLPGAPLIAINLPDPAPWVRADPALLEQALVNVLENAIKYSPPGSLVGLRATAEAATIAVAISDEGIGIAAGDLPHVFDSFYRATRGDRIAPGTGLGLAIARGMIEAIGGAISAQSPRLDRAPDSFPGTIITLRLPRATPA